MRIGIGYDIHRLVEGRQLFIGGVKFEYEKGLLGHSDADVLVHAIMDSILGALNETDIGNLFPDTDMKYKDINSLILLDKVIEIMHTRGYKIVNLDTVVIAQLPKINPKREEIQKVLSKHLHTEKENISIKASTSEGLGAIGRGQAIEARAIVLLQKEKI